MLPRRIPPPPLRTPNGLRLALGVPTPVVSFCYPFFVLPPNHSPRPDLDICTIACTVAALSSKAHMETAERLPLRPEGGLTHNSNTPADNPSPVSLSCVQCRSRKLRCDRRRPICERCSRQNEKCSYPGLRQRALGRRKTVRELEERIGRVSGFHTTVTNR
jgi:hypothetical protein